MYIVHVAIATFSGLVFSLSLAGLRVKKKENSWLRVFRGHQLEGRKKNFETVQIPHFISHSETFGRKTFL